MQVGGGADGPGGATDLAETVLEAALGHGIYALGAHFVVQVIAEIAIQRAIDLRLPGEGKRQALNVHRGDQIANNSAIQVEEVEFAVHQHLEDDRVAAGGPIIVGEDLDVQ